VAPSHPVMAGLDPAIHAFLHSAFHSAHAAKTWTARINRAVTVEGGEGRGASHSHQRIANENHAAPLDSPAPRPSSLSGLARRASVEGEELPWLPRLSRFR
jgi:hypothetical protein